MAITAVYVDADSFTVVGDRVSEFNVGRRVECNCGVDGYDYGTIESSSYSNPDTTVNLTSGSDNITSNLADVLYGIQGEGVAGSVPIHAHQGNEGDGGYISELAASDGSPNPAVYVDNNGNIFQADGLFFATDRVRARDSDGLLLRDDGNNPGIRIADGGGVTSYGSICTTNGQHEGKVLNVTVDDASVVFGNALYCASDFHYERCDADAAATMPCRCLALQSGAGSKQVLLEGQICNTGWTWTAGDIYVSTSTGGLTQTAPSGTGDQVQRIGWALSATTIYFRPDLTVVEIV